MFALLGNYQHCKRDVGAQARASPYKACVVYYYVMNANSRLRIRLRLQSQLCWNLEHWFIQHREGHAMASIKEGKVEFVFLSLNLLCLHFCTNKIYLNSQLMFEACFTEGVVNFLLSESTGRKWSWSSFGGREEDYTKSGNLTESSLESWRDAHFLPRTELQRLFSMYTCLQCHSSIAKRRIWQKI